jgi:uncharacterized protein YjcR
MANSLSSEFPRDLDRILRTEIQAAERRTQASHFLSIEKLAEELGVHVRTIRRWHARGEGPPRVKRSRKLMYRKADVEVWLVRIGRRTAQ